MDRIPLDDLTSDQLDQLYARLDALENGARERSALLEEARDALENAGAHGAHGNDWPRLAPAIDELGARIAELTAYQCTHALSVCEQHHRVPVPGCPYPRCKAAAARTTA